jgi:hypothetical protein
MNPEEYYHYVEQKQQEQLLEDVAPIKLKEAERWLLR